MSKKYNVTAIAAILLLFCVILVFFWHSGKCNSIDIVPNIKGFGEIPDLHTAIQLDKTGRRNSLLCQFINEQDPSQRSKLIPSLLLAWGGLDNNSTDEDNDYAKIFQFAIRRGILKNQDTIDNYMTPEKQKIIKDQFHNINKRLLSYLSLEIHYKSWYNWARAPVRQHHDLEIPVYVNSLILLSALSETYFSSDHGKCLVKDFLDQLGVYDYYGIEFINAMKLETKIMKDQTSKRDEEHFFEFLEFFDDYLAKLPVVHNDNEGN